MIKGMTGFGSSQFSTQTVKGIVEIKSQNHRYFDAVYYLPVGFGSYENKIKSIVNKDVSRGRVSISVKITHKSIPQIVFHKEVVKGYVTKAAQLKKEFGLSNDLTVSDLMTLPGVIETRETMLNPDALWPAVNKAIDRAIRGVVQMRKAEGRSLLKDVATQLKRMDIHLKKINQRAKTVLKEKKKALPVEEFSSFQKSNDINEELTRAKHYITEIRQLFKSATVVGKRIDFIAQEMQRETNTIGSKLQDRAVANAVVALKSKIEKIREQAQNIE